MSARAANLLLCALLGACQQQNKEEPALVPAKTQIEADGLVVTLTTTGTFSLATAKEVELSVENRSSKPKTFCTHHTPFEGMRNNIFKVTSEGKEVPYRGMMAKRGPPGPEDYLRLAPGESETVKIDLSEGYELVAGRYAVVYRGTGISGLPDSNTIEIVVSP